MLQISRVCAECISMQAYVNNAYFKTKRQKLMKQKRKLIFFLR